MKLRSLVVAGWTALSLGLSVGLISLTGTATRADTPAVVAPGPANQTNTADIVSAAKTALTGKTNLAKGKTATASSSQDGNGVANGIDGDTTTRWCASDGSAPQWYSVDLGTSQPISGVHIDWEQNNPYQYIVEASDDNTKWHTIADLSKNTYSNQDDYILTPNASGRYVRVTVSSSSNSVWVSFFEFEIFGK